MESKELDRVSFSVISDTHGKGKYMSGVTSDVAIHCGDFTNYGGLEDLIKEINCIVDACNSKLIIISPGNHDIGLDESKPEFILPHIKDHVFNLNKKQKGKTIILAVNEELFIKGNKEESPPIKVLSFPYSKEIGTRWAFMRNEQGINDLLRSVPNDIDLLISHGPPYSILDMNDCFYPCGSHSHYDFIERVNRERHLKANVFGHIHESRGSLVREIGGKKTLFINASSLDFRTMMLRNWFEFDMVLDKDGWKVDFLSVDDLDLE